jgi:hypothetical protein
MLAFGFSAYAANDGAFVSDEADPDGQAAVNRTHVAHYQTVASPDRQLVALCGVGLGDVSPGVRMRLRILVVHVHGPRIEEINTSLEREWVVAWSSGNVLLACGEPDEPNPVAQKVYAYRCPSLGTVESVPATSENIDYILKVFKKRYGHGP